MGYIRVPSSKFKSHIEHLTHRSNNHASGRTVLFCRLNTDHRNILFGPHGIFRSILIGCWKISLKWQQGNGRHVLAQTTTYQHQWEQNNPYNIIFVKQSRESLHTHPLEILTKHLLCVKHNANQRGYKDG